MVKLVECVPNFSEGRDQSIIQAIAGSIKAVEGVTLLDIDAGWDFNRTVFTFVGSPDAVLEAAFQSAKTGISLIDMRQHKGEHARMGALDVMPFIPISDVTMKDCVTLSKEFGRRVADELGIPIFLYANSATKTEHANLPNIRKGEYEGLEGKLKENTFLPDYGPSIFIPKSGVSATGAREILIAYNINLNTADKTIASTIAGKIRTSGVIKKDRDGNKIIGADGKPERIPGRFKWLQAGGMMYNENIAQVSMNLLNYKEVNVHDVFDAVKDEAKKLNTQVTGSEIVGVIPKEALLSAGRHYFELSGSHGTLDETSLMTTAIEKLGLSDLYPFKVEEKVIEYIISSQGALVSMEIITFIAELASNSPAPGGGSVAALSGALSAALSSMVCNLTLGKEKYADVQDKIQDVLVKADALKSDFLDLIDRDTQAFNEVIAAFKLPKNTDAEKQRRSEAIAKGYKTATKVPLETASLSADLMNVALDVAKNGNKNSITDAGVSAIMAKSAFDAASLNVRINLPCVKDEAFMNDVNKQLDAIEKEIKDGYELVINLVEKCL